ncbi:MAG: voltage-gated chloride channel family protein [Undibacterium sp.]|nr:voltage-gated chloride channel family protein [Opitutaceae bacterium]
MPRSPHLRETFPTLRLVALETLLAVPVGLLAGSASALFLWALDRVTETRWQNPWLLWLLPVGGFAVGWTYLKIGGKAAGGTNLVFDQIHAPGGGVPARIAPLVLIGTLVTHLGGGSAGREGTAIQMGGSLASAFGRLCRIDAAHLRVLLMAGVAAGFGSVFGTPLAGAIFALEVLVIGRVRYDALIPVLVASTVGDATCSAWGIHHALYHIGIGNSTALHAALDPLLMAKVVGAALLFGLVSRFFAEITHALQNAFKRLVAYAPLRPVFGGVLVIALVYIAGTRDYLGIGVSSPDPAAITLLASFHIGGATTWSWAWKLLFTVVTLASGFKGGEVTPLFFIGATLGHALALAVGAPVDLFAGLGFIAVFAGATNTPLACTLMGVELFGAHYAIYFAVACWLAYALSGHSGIYAAQRLDVPKHS